MNGRQIINTSLTLIVLLSLTIVYFSMADSIPVILPSGAEVRIVGEHTN